MKTTCGGQDWGHVANSARRAATELVFTAGIMPEKGRSINPRCHGWPTSEFSVRASVAIMTRGNELRGSFRGGGRFGA